MPDDRNTIIAKLRAILDEPTTAQRLLLPTSDQRVVSLPGGDEIPIPRPPPFRRSPDVVGSPEVARLVERLLAIAPELRGQVHRVQMGPSGDVVDRLQANKHPFNPEDFPKLNLLGTTNTETGNISLNPRLSDEGGLLERVIGHELTHAGGNRGQHGEDVPRLVESLLRELQTTDVPVRRKPQ